jgi:hypothetical protein
VLCSALINSLLMGNLHAKGEQCNLIRVDETGKAAAAAELQLQLCSRNQMTARQQHREEHSRRLKFLLITSLAMRRLHEALQTSVISFFGSGLRAIAIKTWGTC